jgi:hypothetical protein
MAQLWLREGGRVGRSLQALRINPEVLLVSWIDVDQCLWLEQNGKRIGLSALNISQSNAADSAKGKAAESPGFTIDSRTWLQREIMGLNLPVEMASRTQVNASFEMETMMMTLRLAGKELRLQAFVEDHSLYYFAKMGDAPVSATLGGLGAGAVLGAMIQLPRTEVCGRAPLKSPLFMADAVIPLLMRTAELKVGESWETEATNPLAGLVNAAALRVTVEGREKVASIAKEPLDAWRLVEQVGELRSTLWYDVQGRLLRSEEAGGLRQERTTRSQAEQAYPALKRSFPFPENLDRAWIRQHLDPKLDGTPLEKLIPALPGLGQFEG